MKISFRFQSKLARLYFYLTVMAVAMAILLFSYAEQGYIIAFVYAMIVFGMGLGLGGASIIAEKEQYDMNKVMSR